MASKFSCVCDHAVIYNGKMYTAGTLFFIDSVYVEQMRKLGIVKEVQVADESSATEAPKRTRKK